MGCIFFQIDNKVKEEENIIIYQKSKNLVFDAFSKIFFTIFPYLSMQNKKKIINSMCH